MTDFYHLAPSKKKIIWVLGRSPWYSTWTSRMNTYSLIKITSKSRYMSLMRTSSCLKKKKKKKCPMHSRVQCKWISDYWVSLLNVIVSCCNWSPHYYSTPKASNATNYNYMSCTLKVLSTFGTKYSCFIILKG